MREIKFRAWSKDENKMYVNVPSQIMEFKGNIFKPHSFWGNDDIEIHAIPMQYTGLKDKNGVEIYEGDIIQDCENNMGEVVYILDHCQFLINMGEGIDLQEVGDWCEVIGNIYENPELLEMR